MGERRKIEIVAGEDAEDAGDLACVVDVVRQDATVGVFAAHEVDPRGIDVDIFDIRTADGQHPRVFDPLHAIAEDAAQLSTSHTGGT